MFEPRSTILIPPAILQVLSQTVSHMNELARSRFLSHSAVVSKPFEPRVQFHVGWRYIKKRVDPTRKAIK